MNNRVSLFGYNIYILPARAVRVNESCMSRVFIVSDQPQITGLSDWMKEHGFRPYVLSAQEEILEGIGDKTGGLVMVFLNNFSLANNMCRIIKQEKKLPVLMLVSAEKLGQIKLPLEADDFTVYDGPNEELLLRLQRLLPGNIAGDHEQIFCGDLVIDLASCEVLLKGEVLDLTYREYELLKFLAANRGRTFTREVLLNRVWGYDYFGGDRTVDVHIRRLRTKTGDLDRPYIETVRNIGYRFRKND